MTAEHYVKQIVRKVRCDKKRRQDIGKELLAEIQGRMSGGEALEDIMSDMGSVREIADGFNDSLSETDKKKYRRKKTLLIISGIVLALLLLTLGAMWMLPVAHDLESSDVFSKEEVESTLKEVIELLDQGDYAALEAMSDPRMAPAFQGDRMNEAKAMVCADFGERTGFGTIYASEVIQQNRRMAVCQVNVSYENTSITYTVTFDEDMKLIGLYMK